MLIVTFINVFAILITFLGRVFRNERSSFFLAILLLIAFYSIRGNYGNDIPSYLDLFNRISSFTSWGDIVDENGERVEPGWVVLNFFFAPFGWQIFLFFLTAFQFYTVYHLITNFVKPQSYWLIFAIYIFTANLLLTDLSMLRQAFCMHVSCWTIPWILERKILKAGVVIILLTTIHTSAFAMITLLLVPYFCKLKPNILAILFLGIFISLSIAEALVGDMFKIIFATDTFEKYQIYERDSKTAGIGLGVLLNLIVVCWLFLRYSNQYTQKFFNIIFALPILIIPFGQVIPLVARIGMYFSLISIVCYQYLSDSKKDGISKVLLISKVLICVIGYFEFFENPTWKPYFSVYRTIFD